MNENITPDTSASRRRDEWHGVGRGRVDDASMYEQEIPLLFHPVFQISNTNSKLDHQYLLLGIFL